MAENIFLDRNWLSDYPVIFTRTLIRLGRNWPEMYVTGGAVRDWLRGEHPGDLDLTVAGDAPAAARLFAAATGGAYILLDADEGVARVVTQGQGVDFSSFREGTTDIVSDLARRDFSINAMAVAVDPTTGTLAPPYLIIDPLGGAADLALGLVRAPAAAVFDSDPLRLLRAFRFASTLGLAIEEKTGQWIKSRRALIAKPSPERLRYELDLVMASPLAASVFVEMADFGLLAVIFPELFMGAGLVQPASHHLDVLGHNLAALTAMAKLLRDPAAAYPDPEFAGYLALPARPELLKWAALFHDLGKPETAAVKDDGRATFYNHDQAGARLFSELAGRLRWSRERSAIVARLIELHMYPFHLNNAAQKTGIIPPGLSAAGQGRRR